MKPQLATFLGCFLLSACGGESNDAEARRLEDAAVRLERAAERLDEASARLDEVAAKLERSQHPRPPPPSTPSTTGDEPSQAEVDAAAGKLLDALRCEGDTCTVPRAVLDSVLDQPELLARTVRVVPTTKADQVLGYKLYAIRAGSLFDRLGFENGDMVKSVDGKALDSPEAAMLAYETLRAVSEVEVALERRGAPRTLKLRIAQ